MRILGLALIFLGAFLSLARAASPQPDGGDRLLYAVKAVADSGQADNLATVSALMHLSFRRVTQTKGEWCQPNAQSIENDYIANSVSWFSRDFQKIYADPSDPNLSVVPNGEGSYQVGFGFSEPAYAAAGGKYSIFNSPQIRYSYNALSGCTGLPQNGTSASITIFDIPAYACISPVQIKAIFSKATPTHLPPPGSTAPMGADSYDYASSGAAVGFVVLPVPAAGTDRSNEPDCLIQLRLEASYPLGPLHKPDFAN